jgi:hypothetical protein
MFVRSFSYPAHKAHAQFYTVIRGLFGFTTFFHIISQTPRFSGGGERGTGLTQHDEIRVLIFSIIS